MRVLKFGGTSVGSAGNLATVRDIVARYAKEPLVVVVSAHSGVTDALLGLARNAVAGGSALEPLRERHRELLQALGMNPSILEPLFAELHDLLRGLSLVRELTPRSLDLVASFGERLSVRGIAPYFRAGGIPATPVDAYDVGLRTDSRFTAANADYRCFPAVRKLLGAVPGVPVVTGFIAKDANGDVTTLGRSGSDLTATLLGAALDADEVQIWTDVDGVMTADPRVVKGARSVPVLSIAEASELAYYGAKVIHPATMLPAVENRIPVRVLNTLNPENEGTTILAEAPPSGDPVKSIASKRGIILVTVASTRMLLQSGFMAKIFEVFARHDLSVDLVATGEVTVSVTVDTDRHLEEVAGELAAFSSVTIERDMAQVCVVGHGIGQRHGVAADVLGALKEAKIPVRLISHGGTRINISLLVDAKSADGAVRALHGKFFG